MTSDSPPTAFQVDEALKIKNTDIAKELCLPPVKLHCSSKYRTERRKSERRLVFERETSGSRAGASECCFLNKVSAHGAAEVVPQGMLAYAEILGLF